MWRMALPERKSETNLRHVMYIQRKNVRTVLQSFIAAEDVQQILTTFMETSHDAYDLGCELERNALNGAIMIKAALAGEDTK